ncbi:MAG: MFS transporter [Sphingobium sp.]
MLLALVAAEITCSLESNMITSAIATLYRQYGDPVMVNWLVTAFTLTATASAAICGRLGDMFGRRRVVLILLAVAVVGSLISALADNLWVIVAGRGLQGVTMAILPLGYGILRENMTSEASITRGVAMLGACYSVCSGLAFLIGGFVVDYLPWQALFAITVVTALLSIGLVVAFVPAAQAYRERALRIDWLGAVLLAAGTGGALLGFTFLSSVQKGLAWGLIFAGILMLTVWVWHELRTPEPLIDIRLFTNRTILLGNLAVFFTALGPMMFPLVMMPMFQQPLWTGVGFGLAAATTGLIKLPGSGINFLSAIWGGSIAVRIGIRKVLIFGAFAMLIGWLFTAFNHHSLVVTSLMMLFVLGPGATLIFALGPRIIMQVAPADRVSEATGLTQVVRAMGQAISSQMTAYILATSMVVAADGHARYPSDSAYTATYLVLALCSLVTLVLLFAIPRLSKDQAE